MATMHTPPPDPPMAEEIAPYLARWLAHMYRAKVSIRIERGEEWHCCETDGRLECDIEKRGK